LLFNLTEQTLHYWQISKYQVCGNADTASVEVARGRGIAWRIAGIGCGGGPAILSPLACLSVATEERGDHRHQAVSVRPVRDRPSK
jgi:hypothetical protein